MLPPVRDAEGRVVAPYSTARCEPIRANSTRTRVSWTGVSDLSPIAGEPVRFRFHLTNGRLYAFWVTIC